MTSVCIMSYIGGIDEHRREKLCKHLILKTSYNLKWFQVWKFSCFSDVNWPQRERTCLFKNKQETSLWLTCWLLDIERFFEMMKTKGEHNFYYKHSQHISLHNCMQILSRRWLYYDPQPYKENSTKNNDVLKSCILAPPPGFEATDTT